MDLQQIFFGDTAPLILLEIAFRTVVMYIYLLVLLRMLGARGLAQLSPFEFAIIIALGSAVGDAMFYLDIPLVECLLVITVVVLLQRGIVWITNHNRRLEDLLEGKPYMLIENGIIDLKNLKKTALSHDELFTELRMGGAEQLGQVKYAFLEVNGKMTVFLQPSTESKPGLPIAPPWEIRRPQEIEPTKTTPQDGHYACTNCGNTQQMTQGTTPGTCRVCQKNESWMEASHLKANV